MPRTLLTSTTRSSSARAELGITPDELTERLIDDWLAETRALNALPATVYPRATQEIPGIIEMISHLVEAGHAYVVDGGDVNYRVTSFGEYGKLSHRKLDDMLAGARIEVDPGKAHPLDFALWKGAKPGEPTWESPWGPGRPGWHIECSAMSERYLGMPFDIHGGGADLIFPHHENEIAQAEASCGVEPFARWWVHNGHVQIDGEKMSKSIGNLVGVKELIERGRTRAFRLMVLQSIYRNPLVYTDEALEASARGIERLDTAARGYDSEHAEPDDDTAVAISNADARFREAMDDDFNTPVAVSVLFDLARLANRATGANRSAVQGRLIQLAGVLGLEIRPQHAGAAGGDAGPFIDLLMQVREQLRAQKQWALSDMIRDGLAEQGVTVEDSPSGATWRWQG
jgi:cysteinyl-tRNA synthetase